MRAGAPRGAGAGGGDISPATTASSATPPDAAIDRPIQACGLDTGRASSKATAQSRDFVTVGGCTSACYFYHLYKLCKW
jgi:hypothetical protein